MSFELSEAQRAVYEEIMHFFTLSDRACYVFSGVAGSGKTSLVGRLVQDLASECNIRIEVLAYTGRAASVLRSKGIHQARTIHSLLYSPVVDKKTGNIVGWDRKSVEEIRASADGLIVDEASMVDEERCSDLLDIDLPILFVGDSEQLPPVSKSNFNVMDAADVHLTEIHRQAAGNPIIRMSDDVRTTGRLRRVWDDGDKIRFMPQGRMTKRFIQEERPDIIICAFNKTRRALNDLCRAAYGYTSTTPQIGERVMCLKNQTLDTGDRIYNGEIYEVTQVGEDGEYTLDNSITVIVPEAVWITEDAPKNKHEHHFTYAYASSAWKMQGSQIQKVVFVDQDVSFFTDRKKFRYTAITRAEDELIVAY